MGVRKYVFNKDHMKEISLHNIRRLSSTFRWILLACLVGSIAGFLGSSFFLLLKLITEYRMENSWTLYFLPIGGIAIIALYHLIMKKPDKGTNLALDAIHFGARVPIRRIPLIYFATLITHFFGGSAGREGAALQMGASLGDGFSRIFHLKESDKKILIICSMSACFSAVFGTPLSASIFAMEIVTVGVIYYVALVPCVVASLISHGIAHYFFGISTEIYPVSKIPPMNIPNFLWTILLAGLCGLLSILFCVSLRFGRLLYKRCIKNDYLRAITGAILVILLTLLVGNRDYNGAGLFVIKRCFTDPDSISAFAFLLKIIFTVITLGAGFKGGEIVPSFFIGACFGCLFGKITGLETSLCSAIGMGSVFCGATNAPIASLLICFEMFGFEGMPYYLLAIAISYNLSGYFGLYKSQKFAYSKYQAHYIDKSAC